MEKQEIIAKLKKEESALRMRGVLHAALFGSHARGDNDQDSDIDILVEVDLEAHLSVFDYVELKDYIAAIYDAPVDVVSLEGLKPYIRPMVTADAAYAF